MNYAAFKGFVLRYLWREGDDEFEPDLDTFILMAEGRLTRDLRGLQRLEETSDLIDADANLVDLPADYRVMRSVVHADTGVPLAYVPPYELARQRAAFLGASRGMSRSYSVTRGKLMLAGTFSVENPVPLVLTYSAKVPSFITEDETWLTEAEYFDLYLFATLRHTAGYLRADQRVQLWKDSYNEVLQSVLDEDAARRYAGGQLEMPMPEGSA